MSVLGNLFGGSDTTVKTEQTQIMPQLQQAGFDTFMRAGLDLFHGGPPQFYPGQLFAGPTETELAGRRMMMRGANSMQGALDAALASNEYFLNPNLNPTEFFGYNAVADDLERRGMMMLERSLLPQIGGGAVGAGGVGGSRQGVLEGVATADTINNILGQQSNLGLNIQQLLTNAALQSQQIAPSLMQFASEPGRLMESVGLAQRGDEQRKIDEARQRFDYEQQAPFDLVNWLQALTGQFGQYGGTTKGKQVTEAPGFGLNQALGAALGGAALFGLGPFNPASNPLMGLLAGGLQQQQPGTSYQPVQIPGNQALT